MAEISLMPRQGNADIKEVSFRAIGDQPDQAAVEDSQSTLETAQCKRDAD